MTMEPPSIPDISDAVKRLATLAPVEYDRVRKAEAKALEIRVTTLDALVERARPRRNVQLQNGLSKADFIMGKEGISALFVNVIELLRVHPEKWRLRYDEFAKRSYCGDDFLTDYHLLAIAEWVQRNGVYASVRTIGDAAIKHAESVRFHPIKDYLESLKWDGISRIDHILIDHAGAEDTDLTRAITSRWLIQAVARIYEPGCTADATLVLEGPQGLGKSTLLRELFGDRWFTDHLPDIGSKDALVQLRGVWCVEIAELATLGRVDAAKIKAFLTSRIDRYRDPYGRMVADFPRTCIFAGTVNPGADGYMKDPTGARRFWPVTVSGKIDTTSIRNSRDQIWAEALTRYRSRESWYLDTSELQTAAAVAQADRFEDDPWDEPIQMFVLGKDFVTTTQVLEHGIGLYKKSEWGRAEQMRVGRWLSHNGWKRFKRRNGTKTYWAFLNPIYQGDVPTISNQNDDLGTDENALI